MAKNSDNIRCIRKYPKKDGNISSWKRHLSYAWWNFKRTHHKGREERSRGAALRHGGHTKRAKTHHLEITALIRQSKNLLISLS